MPDPDGEHVGLEDVLALFAILALPWAFGGVEIWAYRAATLVLVAAVSVALWKGGWQSLGLIKGRVRWLAPAFLLAAWAVFQIVPLPPLVVRVLSPAAYRIYATTLPGYPGGAEPLMPALERWALLEVGDEESPIPALESPAGREEISCGSSWRPVSLHPGMTGEKLHWYLALLAAFLLIRARASRSGPARVYETALLVLFPALAAFAFLQGQIWPTALYGLRPLTVSAHPWGPYVNPGNFAGAMELGLPLLAGCAWGLLRQKETRGQGIVVGFGAVLCLAAGLASGSRAALTLLPAGLLALVFLGVRTRNLRLVVVAVAVVLLVVLVITVVSTDLGLRWRMSPWGGQEMGTPGGRDTVWRFAAPIFRDFPLTGIGFGAFGTVFPRYAPAGFYRWTREVHNDFYEVLLEGGVVAAVLVFWLTWGYAARLMRKLRSRSEVSPKQLGLALGLLALGLHAAVDFNHQIPANALLFVVFAAMAVPLGQPRGETNDTRVFRQRKVLLPLIAVLLVVYAGRAMHGMVGGVAFARGRILAHAGWYWKALPFIDIADVGADRLQALLYGAETRLAFWDYLLDRPDSSVSEPEILVRSSRDFARCVCLAPADVRPLEGLARVYHRMELLRRAEAPGTDAATTGWDSVGPQGRVAIGLLHRSVAFAPGWWSPYDQLALMQWEYGMEAEALDAATQSGRVLPLYHSHAYRRTGAPDAIVDAFARGARESVDRVPLLGGPQYRIPLGTVELNRGRVKSAIEVLEPLLEGGVAASYRAQTLLLLGRAEMALGEYERARTYLEGAADHPDFASEAKLQLARVAREQGQDETAFDILSELRWGEPSLPMLLEYAAVARDLQRWDKAVAALRSAVLVFPEDPRPQRELVYTLAEQGDMKAAREECEKLRTLTENDAGTEQLCQAIEAGSDERPDATTD